MAGTKASTEKERRAAQVADVLSRAVRAGEVHPVDARTIVMHRLRLLNTNKKEAIPTKSVEAQRVITDFATRGVKLPKNDSPDALHADHVFRFPHALLLEARGVERWLRELRRLAMVVCVTAGENYRLEAVEATGVDGPAKYEIAKVVFTTDDLPWLKLRD